MDGSRFDELTRRLGRGVTRRNALKGIVATASGAVLARIGAEQAAARDVQVCHEGETISVPQEELNLRIRQGDQIRIDCCADIDCASNMGQCGQGVCQQGYCVTLPKPAGTPCDDGSFCTSGDRCDGAGSCAAGAPVVCEESENPCTTSVCSESAQGCQDVPVDDGTECGTNDACVSNTCMSGTCVSQDLSDCTGACADCSGECVDLHADHDNCGTCGHACEELGQCFTTTCTQQGTCLDTPVTCPGGDQCNAAACNPDTGCFLQPKTGASCTTAGSNGGTCNANGICELICLPTVTCVVDGDCGAGKRCLNGGCFTEAAQGFCSNECSHCFGTSISLGSSTRVCSDIDFGIGACSTDAQCPLGSYCNPNVGSGIPTDHFLCTRPCPQPAQPV